MLNLTPKDCGSLGHGKRSPQKKATVTKFKSAHLLKWLTAYCVLDNVGAAAVPWSSAELVASGSNSLVPSFRAPHARAAAKPVVARTTDATEEKCASPCAVVVVQTCVLKLATL